MITEKSQNKERKDFCVRKEIYAFLHNFYHLICTLYSFQHRKGGKSDFHTILYPNNVVNIVQILGKLNHFYIDLF